MKKLTLTFTILVIIASITFAQAPQSFKYQAIARDVEGNIISNKQISLRISLLQGSNSGKIVYSETHDLQTTAFGLILLEIGNGNVNTGNFSDITWGNDNYYVSIDIDAHGGTDFVSMGISQLLSVPYA
ncbi:MAG: collagen-like protein, partial [Gammaproteobacteria bacterium]|nr:collagen-like protein [Gammaproteobacteria bacterium]